MAIFHLALKTIGRSKGQSAVASAAYRSGEKLKDRETGEIKDFTKKHGVAYSEIQLPEQAPVAFNDREKLWNAVQSKESRRNSQLAREVEVALPAELDRDTQIKLVHAYVQQNFVDKGMCADWSIHDKEDGNPHAHIMLTTRAIKKNGTWAPKQKSTYLLDEDGAKVPQIDPKTGQQKIGARGRKMWKRTTEPYTDWNDRSNAEQWRSNWAESCNRYLAPENKIDHRSYERQGSDQVPTIHEGHVAREMGERSERVQINRQVKTSNQQILALEQALMDLRARVKALVKQLQEALNERIRRSGLNRTNDEIGRVDSEKRAIDEPTTDKQNQRQPATQLSRVTAFMRDTTSIATAIKQRERDAESRKQATTKSNQGINSLAIAIRRTDTNAHQLAGPHNREITRKRQLRERVTSFTNNLQPVTKQVGRFINGRLGILNQLTAMNKQHEQEVKAQKMRALTQANNKAIQQQIIQQLIARNEPTRGGRSR